MLHQLENQSGVGGTVVLPTTNVTESGGLYGLIEPGSYWVGLENEDDPVSDMHVRVSELIESIR